MYKHIIVAGIPRSGSLMLYLVLKELISDTLTIDRTHGCVKSNNDLIIMTYRDLRDVFTSYAKATNTTIKQVTGESNINRFISATIKAFQNKQDNYFFVKYEDYYPNNLLPLIRNILKKININITISKIIQALNKFSIENIKKESNQFKTFAEWSDNDVHGNHITSDGKTHNWKKLEQKDIILLNNKYKTQLRILGYNED